MADVGSRSRRRRIVPPIAIVRQLFDMYTIRDKTQDGDWYKLIRQVGIAPLVETRGDVEHANITDDTDYYYPDGITHVGAAKVFVGSWRAPH